MARVKGPLMSMEASGNVAGQLQFRGNRHGTHAYRPPDPRTQNQGDATAKQTAVRERYAVIKSFWDTLPNATRNAWNAQAETDPNDINGWTLFFADTMTHRDAWSVATATDRARIQQWRQPQKRTIDALSTPAGAYPGGGAYYGGVLLPDGRVFCVPYNATSARIYDPATNTLSTPAGVYPGGGAYVGGVLLPDGRGFCVPCYATSARIYGTAAYRLPQARVLSAFDNKL